MFCKICGKPISNNGKCLHCGHQQKGYIAVEDINVVTEEMDSSSEKEIEDLPEMLPDDVANSYEQNQATNSENQLALTGMILAICSLFFTILAIPSFIVSVVAVVKANSFNGAGRSKAVAGVAISSFLLVSYIVAIIIAYVVIPSLQS